MIKQGKSDIEFYQSELLLKHRNIGHFFSTKHGDFDSLDKLSTAFEISINNFVIGKQTHSDRIELITNNNKHRTFVGVDAYITEEKGICICVKTADCTPVLLFDPEQNVAAAIHSGWRGTVQNITGKTIAKMINEFRVKPENILAAIGPCIGWQNYEVGEEVADQFRALFPQNSKVVIESSSSNEKPKLSVRQAIFQQLTNSGIQTANIDLSVSCTSNNSSDFHSARRDGPQTGRMVNGIWIK